jgi:hypothetical protein
MQGKIDVLYDYDYVIVSTNWISGMLANKVEEIRLYHISDTCDICLKLTGSRYEWYSVSTGRALYEGMTEGQRLEEETKKEQRKSKRVKEDYYVLNRDLIETSEDYQGQTFFWGEIRWYPHERVKLKRYTESTRHSPKVTDVEEEYDTMYTKYQEEIERQNGLRDQRIAKSNEIITTYVQKDKRYDTEKYSRELNDAKKNVDDLNRKMLDAKYNFESANKKLLTAQKNIADIGLPYVKKIIENLKALGLFSKMNLSLLERYLHPAQSGKYDFLACDYLKDILISNGNYMLQMISTSKQNEDETIQQIQRDIQSFCELFGVSVTLLPVNSSQPTTSFSREVDMSTLLCQMKELNKIV